ncbi:type IV secretion system DNA-binding domain-containing protein [Leptolyngbya sp. GGD]|uniref:type IV secretion system DNA-binding domain-containing protein n=1 Tax=Leptolyngbya sp. GGD TaxID=2997907 RepID=UPI00227D4A5A|nr:type IV secretion system DNA-binding domain-containing protein [Leptolyngbya sp. GGD]MCY6494542.1 type IV secretion system DNA-binding domain-containing protein [Leptolyngbya sp. GGD]
MKRISRFFKDFFGNSPPAAIGQRSAIHALVTNSLKELERQPPSMKDIFLGQSASGEYIRFGSCFIPIEWTAFHTIYFGATGAGKTNLLNMQISGVLDTLKHNPTRRVIINDYKGDAPAILKGHGVEYVMLSVDYQEGHAPDIAKDFDSYNQLRQFGFHLIPERNQSDPFWETASRLVLAGVAQSFFHTQGTNFKLHDFDCLLQQDFATLLRVLAQCPSNKNIVRFILSEVAEKTSVSVMANLIAEIGKISHASGHSQNVGKYLSVREFLFSQTPPAQVLVISQRKSTREVTNPLMGIVIDRVIELFLDSPEHRDVYGNEKPPWLYIFNDELAASGKYKKIREFVSAARSKGGSAFLATQDVNGLQELYGEKATGSIVGNCNFKVMCSAPLDGVTAQWMASFFGEKQYAQLVPSSISSDPKSGEISLSMRLDRFKQQQFTSGDFTSIPLASKEIGISAVFHNPINKDSYFDTVEPQLVDEYKRRYFPVSQPTPLSPSMELVGGWSESERRRFVEPEVSPTRSATHISNDVDLEIFNAAVDVLATLVSANPNDKIGEVWKRCGAVLEERMIPDLMNMSEAEKQRILAQFNSKEV